MISEKMNGTEHCRSVKQWAVFQLSSVLNLVPYGEWLALHFHMKLGAVPARCLWMPLSKKLFSLDRGTLMNKTSNISKRFSQQNIRKVKTANRKPGNQQFHRNRNSQQLKIDLQKKKNPFNKDVVKQQSK